MFTSKTPGSFGLFNFEKDQKSCSKKSIRTKHFVVEILSFKKDQKSCQKKNSNNNKQLLHEFNSQ